MSTTQSERTKQRRRLLKSAAAVPAIFALPAGAQVANSSLNACVDKGLPPPNTILDNPIAGSDQWVRKFQATDQNGNAAPGNYLQFVDGKPVATASCWNSVHPGANVPSDTNLIP